MKRFTVITTSIMSIMLFITLNIHTVTAEQTTDPVNGEGYANNRGVKIWYKVEGTSTSNSIPIILIHGGPGATARPFEKTIGPEIAKSRQVIYMDYRGAGRSDRPEDSSEYSFEILASDVEAVRKNLGIDKWSVFGHSNGGATAITYALNYPDHVSALILCCPLLGPVDLEMNMIHKVALSPPEVFEEARTIYKSNQSDEVRFEKLLDIIDIDTRNMFQYYNPGNRVILDTIQSDLAQEIGKDLMVPALINGLISSGFFEFDAFKSANDLTMPIFILLGRYDSEISLDNAMKFACTVPNGYITVLNKSGHHPYIEETEESAQSVNSFLHRHSDNLTSHK